MNPRGRANANPGESCVLPRCGVTARRRRRVAFICCHVLVFRKLRDEGRFFLGGPEGPILTVRVARVMSGGGGGGGERGRAAHGLEPRDFRHTGLRLEWGHEHSADSFEVFALAVSGDGTTIAAGGASPNEPGIAHIRVWRLGDDIITNEGDGDDSHWASHARGRPPSGSSRTSTSASSTNAVLLCLLKAEGAVAALSVALDKEGAGVFAGMADGTLWGWDLPGGGLRFGGREEFELLDQRYVHPALAKLPRRRRPRRNPFASAFAADRANGVPDPRPIRSLSPFEGRILDSINGVYLDSNTQTEPTYLMGVIGGHGVFPVWDGATGYAPGFDANVPAQFKDDPSFDEDGVCHVVMHPDGSHMYSTTVDAKALRAWDLRCDPGVGTGTGSVDGHRAWQSKTLAVRNVYLAGLAALPRPSPRNNSSDTSARSRRHPSPLLLATCAAAMMPGTCYAEPDSPLRIVLVDASDGKEVRRFPLEGVTACNRFIDCSSLTSGGGGTLLFLAHKDGSVWIHGASNGAQLAALHDHANGPGTSGHHRLLPACVARTVDEEFLYVATTDGECVHRWKVGVPSVWTRASHKRFPYAFKDQVRTLALCARATWMRNEWGFDWSGVGAASDPGETVDVAAGVASRGESFASGTIPELWGEGFARLVSVEPAILELVVARMAKLAHGSEVGELL